MKRSNTTLKVALLSTQFPAATINAITANIPEMAASFPEVSLATVELVATVPSLFQMVAVLCTPLLVRRLGLKRTLLLGVALCSLGVAPLFVQSFALLLATRCLFGFGRGLIASTFVTLAVRFFEGEERSQVLGLQGSIGGMGSAIATFVAGLLLGFGWHVSFAVYAVALPVLALCALWIPATPAERAESATRTRHDPSEHALGLAFWALLMFATSLVASFYVVKASTLMVTYGYGTSQDGSLTVVAMSVGSMVSGALYAPIRKRLGDASLTLYLALAAAGFALAAFVDMRATTIIGGFLVGYAIMAYNPFFLDNIARDFSSWGQAGTNAALVAQGIGGFATPYLGMALGKLLPSLHAQFLFCGLAFAAMALVWVVVSRRSRG